MRDFPERRHPDRRLRHEGHAGRRAGRGRRGAEGGRRRSSSARSSRTRSRRSRRRRAQAGAPVVAFSSDAGVAGPGVYLLSFLPSDDVNRIVSYSASQGRKSFAALLPANAYGAVAEAAFRSAVATAGGRIVAIQSYQTNDADMRAKAAAIAARRAADRRAAHARCRRRRAGDRRSARRSAASRATRCSLLGSGQWDDPRILNRPGAGRQLVPGAARGRALRSFARKYQAAYGAAPPRNATLAYDATVLAAGLVRQFGANRFEASVLTSPNGFAGIDGVFRFLPSGPDRAAPRRLRGDRLRRAHRSPRRRSVSRAAAPER